jgi:beta-N-acetylglucosaminidase
MTATNFQRQKKSCMQQATKKPYDLKTAVDWRGQVEDNYQHFIYNSKFFRKKMHPFEYDQLEEDQMIAKGSL